jgi:hypothetical protein
MPSHSAPARARLVVALLLKLTVGADVGGWSRRWPGPYRWYRRCSRDGVVARVPARSGPRRPRPPALLGGKILHSGSLNVGARSPRSPERERGRCHYRCTTTRSPPRNSTANGGRPCVEVNDRFGAVAAACAADKATVWVHDYQLQLVPSCLRRRRPDVRIGLFNHVPFPDTKYSRSCRGDGGSSRECWEPI